MRLRFSHLWQRICAILAPRPSYPRVFRLDEDSSSSLRRISEREQRPETELAAELLSAAIDQRLKAEENLSLWQGLTEREQQVIALSCLGYSNVDIARRLFLSKETVKSHIQNGVKRYGLRTKAQLLHSLHDFDFSAWDQPSGQR